MELTLADHAKLFFEERGSHPPDESVAYRLWVEYAFGNMQDKTPKVQEAAMEAIEQAETLWRS